MENWFFHLLWQITLKPIIFIIKLWFRLLTYTGLVYPMAVYLGFWLLVTMGVFVERVENRVAIINATAFHIFIIILTLSYIPMIITLVRNITKTVKKIRDKHFPKDESMKTRVDKRLKSEISHGFVFGSQRGKPVIKPETTDGHILVVGGVGSGKSSCIAIPTLRAWGSRVFAIDIKGELYKRTQANRPNIKVFNPLDTSSYGYDPYVFLKQSLNPVQEARAIAQTLIQLPPNIQNPFWIKNAQNILTGAILHYYHEGLSFIDTLKQIQGNSPQDIIKTVSQSNSENARLCVGNFVGMADKTLSEIYAELGTEIVTLVTDYDIVSALSRERVLSPADLEYGEDIYINIPEYLLRQWHTLLMLIVNQFLDFFERRDENNDTPILFLLDEFPRIGKIPAITDGLATLRSKKISICLIVQSLAQLDEIYGQNQRKIILDTCTYKAIMNAKDADTQEYFSRMAGTYDKTEVTDSESGILGVNTSVSRREMEKRIIKPHEFGNMADIVLFTPFDVTLTMPNPHNKKPDKITAGFCRVDKTPYYSEEK